MRIRWETRESRSLPLQRSSLTGDHPRLVMCWLWLVMRAPQAAPPHWASGPTRTPLPGKFSLEPGICKRRTAKIAQLASPIAAPTNPNSCCSARHGSALRPEFSCLKAENSSSFEHPLPFRSGHICHHGAKTAHSARVYAGSLCGPNLRQGHRKG
jgi:hypothetical protein